MNLEQAWATLKAGSPSPLVDEAVLDKYVAAVAAGNSPAPPLTTTLFGDGLAELIGGWGGGSSPPAQEEILWGAWVRGAVYGSGYGDWPWDANSLALFEQHAGKQISLAHWGWPFLFKVYSNVIDNAVNAGQLPMIDMNLIPEGGSAVQLTDIASGRYDAQIDAWADALGAYGKDVLIRLWWEMNGTWFPHGSQAKANPTAFVNAWRRIVDRTVNAGAENVGWVWCPNTVFSGSTPLESLFPGKEYVTWTGMDAYNWGPGKGGWIAFDPLVRPTYDQILALAPSLPMMFGEIGCEEEGGSKEDWLKNMWASLPNYLALKAICWFNWTAHENGRDWHWEIESSPEATAAFKAGVANPRYLASA